MLSLVVLSFFSMAMTTAPTVLAERKEPSDHVCASLAEGSENNKLNILCVGMIRHTLLLVTKDFYVYELSGDSLKGSDNGTVLYVGSKPVPLATKWPALGNDARFKNISKHIYNCFTAMDSVSDYLMLVTLRELTGDLAGLKYDLKNNKVTQGFRMNSKPQVMLSANEKMLFYGLRNASEKATAEEMAPFTFVNQSDLHQKDIGVENATGIKCTGEWHTVCAEGDEVFLAGSNGTGDKACKTPPWKNVLKGFIDGEQVYLFGSIYVYIFSLDAVTSVGKHVPVNRKRYDAFIVCHPDYLKWALIALGVLILLLLLLLLLWLCCCRGKKRKGKAMVPKSTKSSKPKPKSQKHNATVRSRMSGKKSGKSKKSQQGLSQHHDATGRSAFASRKSAKKSQKGTSQHPKVTRRSGYVPASQKSKKGPKNTDLAAVMRVALQRRKPGSTKKSKKSKAQ